MKIDLDNDAIYYKCVLLGIIPVMVLVLIGWKDAVAAYVAYIVIGLPIIFLAKMVFSKFFFGEKYYVLIEEKIIVVRYSNRFDEVEEKKYSTSTVKVIHKNIPCLEALTFDAPVAVTLPRYMFSSSDYKKMMAFVRSIHDQE